MARASLDPNFREFLKSLNSAGVKYLVIGGYAVNYHGYHRMTKDLDVWIAIDPDNAARVSRVLQEFGGFSPSKVKPSMFLTTGQVFQFGRVPVRIDILTAPSGLEFDECHARRVVERLDDVEVPLISLADLRVNKKASGRTKDLADLESLPQPRAKRASRKKRS